MSDGPAVSLSGVGKRYRKYEDTAVLASTGIHQIRKTRKSDIWALRGVDLEVGTGEFLGVIGRNGGGKTTMLKLLAGVSAPTEGRVVVRGRVAPLMAVGVGFHQELTGRENVYINATILGRSREEIDATFDSIVAFADIGSFIDTPTKFYSSGMMVRLGFAVAICSYPDVMLLDEVLAVGDVAFQAKCFERLQEIRSEGTTVLMVSHNLGAIRVLCERVLVLNEGSPVFLGPTAEALSVYHQILAEAREPEEEGQWASGVGGGDEMRLASFELLGAEGTRTGHIDTGERTTARVVIEGAPGRRCPDIELVLSTGAGLTTYRQRWPVDSDIDTDGQLTCDVEFPATLSSGTYSALINLTDGSDGALASAGPISFFVSGRRGVFGLADLQATFTRSNATDVAETP